MSRGRTLKRQWEKVEVMKRKTGNLRTTMRMGTEWRFCQMVRNTTEHVAQLLLQNWCSVQDNYRQRS
jgi:hypothetical protein